MSHKFVHRAVEVFMNLTAGVYVVLATGFAVGCGCFPLVCTVVLIHDFAYWPTYVCAFALSVPSIAAGFAVFRDCPAVQTADRSSVTFPDWLASPYVEQQKSVAVFRPFVKAYIRVWLRVESVAVPLLLGEGVLIYDIMLLLQLQYGMVIIPVVVVLAAVFLQAVFISCVLIVELPHARWYPLMRNSVLLAVRRGGTVIITAVLAAGYGYTAMKSPFLAACVLTGFFVFVLWACARWQSQLLLAELIRPTHDERLMAIYNVSASPRRDVMSGLTNLIQ